LRDYYLAVGGSRHGQLLERFCDAWVTLVPVLAPVEWEDPPSAEISVLDAERYTLRFYRLDKGLRHAAYFVLDTLSGEEALSLINTLENENEDVPFG
jgi:hypothetical protein